MRSVAASRLAELEPGTGNRVQLAPGMAPRACSIIANYSSELEPRYGIEP
jgi:hypothetical protein